MIKGEKLTNSKGQQVALFPLSYIRVSQADYGTYSHNYDTYYATDFLGWNADGRVLLCEYYAPVDMTCIYIDKSESCIVWQSNEEVEFADGSIDYLGCIFYHDNNVADGDYSVGDTVSQGDVIGHTGTAGNVTGDHVHLETGKGKWNSNSSTGKGTAEYKYHFTDYTTVKRIRCFNALYGNDTVISLNDTNNEYDWKTYEDVTPTPTPTSKKSWIPLAICKAMPYNL